MRRQSFAEPAAHSWLVDDRAGNRHYECRQPFFPVRVGDGDDRALAHLFKLSKYCFDFSRFNAKSSDLDLIVAAAHEFQLAIGEPAHHVAGAIELLAEFSTEKRIFVPIDSIPKLVKEAFISAEDKNFYQHRGVNPEGIARAAVTDLKNLHSEKRPVGASTITQQVARNFLLTNEVSISRKIKEMILAFRIEGTSMSDFPKSQPS